jgi:lysophospholipase L1-like esterase
MTYLALGDSYTIGESVLLTESFPHQAVQALRQKGMNVTAPEIIAKTGWTTDELQTAINNHKFLPEYDFVSLLIGVNNQYRSYPVEQYEKEFEVLLKQAIKFAGGDAGHVVVLSIPDWGATPFAEGRDRQQIATEIDAYNAINKKISEHYNVHYTDITPGTKEAATDNTLVAADGLHPSGKEYERWAQKVAKHFVEIAEK